MHLSSFGVKSLLAGAALAGLTVLACGEDAPATTKDEDEATEEEPRDKKDAGKGKDAGKRDARADEDDEDDDEDDAESCTGREARECDDCDNAPCGQICRSGKWSNCESVEDTVSNLLDGGLSGLIPEGGIRVFEGGVSVTLGDASINVPTMDCPAPLECASRGMGLAGMLIAQALPGGASFCSNADAIGLPPACMTAADCAAAGLTTAMCTPLATLGSYCIQLCQ